MSKFKKWLIPVVIVGLLAAVLVSGNAGLSLGEIFDPSGNPFVNRFSDEKDIRTATFVVAASDSVHRYDADFRCSGANDHVQIQAALDRLPATGGHIFFLDGTYNLGAQVLRAIDDVKFMGCGQATLLNLDGMNPVITAGARDGWLFTHFATDAGGVNIAGATESAIRSVWIAGVRTDDPAAVSVVPATLVVAANDSVDPTRADIQCSGAADDVDINVALATGAGGKVVLLEGNYQITANLTVPADTHFSGMGKGTILTTTDAVAITNMVVVNGDNVTISDMKLVLGAGAGDAGSRPNVIYATGRTKLLLENLWIYGDKTVDDATSIRQNGIYFTATNDSKIVNNRVENNKASGINLYDCDYCLVSGNTSQDNERNGVEVGGDSNYNIVVNNTCCSNLFDGINNAGTSDYNTYDSNFCKGNTQAGIHLAFGISNTVVGNACQENAVGINPCGATYTDVIGNTCYGNTGQGIKIDGDYNNISGNMIWSEVGNESIYLNSSDYCTVSGNSCLGAGAHILATGITNTTITGNLVQGGEGISLRSTSNHNTITGNTCSDSPSGSGIEVQESHYNTVSGNTCENNAARGIYIYRSSYNTISGNTVTDNPEGIYVKGTSGKEANYNFVTSNSCRGNDYNIDISGGAFANHNRIIDNETSDGNLLLDAGTDTEFNSIIVPFSDGTEPQDSGYLIDTNGDTARAWLILPLEVQVVIKLKIYARAVDASGTTMALEINVNGGASNEAYTTHATAAPNTPSTTTNFAADDVIFWELSSVQIVALNAGDSIQVVVLHEAANGGGIETDAYIRTVEIEYQ